MNQHAPEHPSIGTSMAPSIMPGTYATDLRTARTNEEQSSTSGDDVPSSDARGLRDPDPSASRRQAALDAARRDLAAAAAKYRDAANWYSAATRSKP